MALALAVIGSSWQLVAFAAPLLGVLASMPWQRVFHRVQVHAEPGLLRCFESDQVELSVWAATDSDGVEVAITAEALHGSEIEVVAREPRLTIAVSARRWGRYPLTVRVDAVAHGGLVLGSALVEAAEVFVFPIAPPQPTPIPRAALLDRLGTRMTRHVGRGVEYAGVRAYAPGDQLRSVNWPVSARRGSLHVTERLSERAADVVVVVDTYLQPPGPATEATERCARGAVQVVQSALQSGDRAGIVVLGGKPRWLGADIGRRQFYRVLDAVLGAGTGFHSSTGTLAPRPAVPAGAVVVAFSTLIETDFALALIELCQRGHVVVIVDVLEGMPFAEQQDPLIARMWSMQRSFMHRDMRTIGVDVVSWQSGTPLDQALRLVPDRRGRLPGLR
jgi:uncharacterized protein (DUF58 family)